MAKSLIVCLLLLTIIAVPTLVSTVHQKASIANADPKWFRDAKLGIFIHWGVYSILGRGEWVMHNDKIPIPEYEKLASEFNPTEFNAENWVALVKAAGAKYITITAKHHDGFCLFDSKLTDYDSVNTIGRDFMAEIAEAARAQRIKLFFYYSLLDWHNPAYKDNWPEYVKYYQAQVRELLTNYGDIAGIWFDGWWDKPQADWDLSDTYQMIHQIQPWALVGNNHGNSHKNMVLPGEDFQIFERKPPLEDPERFLPAEACDTINKSWGYNASDADFKTSQDLIRLLVEVVGRGGNLLLNIGPCPDGTIPSQEVNRLHEIGRWLGENGEAIYETWAEPLPAVDWGYVVHKGRRLYFHILNWPKDGTFRLTGVQNGDVSSAHMMNGINLDVKEGDSSPLISLPQVTHNEVDTIVVLEMIR